MPSQNPAAMTAITIVGGVYHERCLWPDWDQIYGSAGRAAAAMSGHVGKILLRSYAPKDIALAFEPYASVYGFEFAPVESLQAVSFEYVHSLSIPAIKPALPRIRANTPINVSDDVVLRFGMLEGEAIVNADRCVYDPQSTFNPQTFTANGSKANHLAIVANRTEVQLLVGSRSAGADPLDAAKELIRTGAEVVVVKAGVDGAYVVEARGITPIPAYRADRVWTVGSGDVFAAMFAAQWGVHGAAPTDAADFASRAVASYVGSMGLPIPAAKDLRHLAVCSTTTTDVTVYLAGPFFTVAQRWLVDEARRCLSELGLSVFSPVHDVGPGDADDVAPADLAALKTCDVVFAILDGLDSGTLFEVGYARALNKPVYGLAQTVSSEELKMVTGSGCLIFDDFVTALHHVAWRQ